MLGPLKLLEHRIVLIPVNNQEQDTAGTHWSLMFFLPESRSFHHIDSLDPANNESAHKIAKSIVNGLDITGANIITYHDAGVQKNKHDCGVYVLRNAEKAIKQLFSYGIDDNFEATSTKDMSYQRRKVLQTVLDLSKSKYAKA